MIPIDTLSENARRHLVFMEDGGFVSIESIQEYSLPRGLHKLDMLEQQKRANATNWSAVAKIEKAISALDSALSEIHALVNPSLVGSPYGGPQIASGGTDELGLTRCRFRGCPELVTRDDRFFHSSICRSCRNKLPDPESTTTEVYE